MPVTVTNAEYIEGITQAPDRFLIPHARWENMPAGRVVRDIIERFITPKCYLVIPGTIADGPPVSIVIGEGETPAYRPVGDVLTSFAIICGYRLHITLDGRLHFGPGPS